VNFETHIRSSFNCVGTQPFLIESFQLSVGPANVFCAYITYSYLNAKAEDRQNVKATLLSAVWPEVLLSTDNTGICEDDIIPQARIVSDKFGKPRLMIRGQDGPPVSFSYSVDRLWATLCPYFYPCGIDAARPSEFDCNYPFSSVFGRREFQLGLELTQSDPSETAALLWSCKEATVKAVGCGFHLFKPFDVRIVPRLASSTAFEFYGEILRAARRKMPSSDQASIIIRSFKYLNDWVSIALIDPNYL